MTRSEIVKFAKWCAENAFDAHGVDNQPSPKIAYDFTRQLEYDLTDGSDEAARAVFNSLEISHGSYDWHFFVGAYTEAYAAFCTAAKEPCYDRI